MQRPDCDATIVSLTGLSREMPLQVEWFLDTELSCGGMQGNKGADEWSAPLRFQAALAKGTPTASGVLLMPFSFPPPEPLNRRYMGDSSRSRSMALLKSSR